MIAKPMAGLTVCLVAVVGTTAPAQAQSPSCWGQASKVFAQTGQLGEHSATQETPRLGLRNLARALYDDGVIGGDSMADLGAFVAAELGLSIDACQ